MGKSATYICGVGIHPFGRFENESVYSLGRYAVLDALKDSGLGWKDIEAVFCGHIYADMAAGHRTVFPIGQTGIPITNVENGCSSGGTALKMAMNSLLAGEHETVLVLGLEKMPKGFIDMTYFETWRRMDGQAVNPAYFAMDIKLHMEKYGTTAEHLAAVVVKNRANGVHNPNAFYRKQVSTEEVLGSRMVCDPLRLFMLCSPDEGAAAVVLTTRKRPRSVEVASCRIGTFHYGRKLGEHMPSSTSTSFDPPSVVKLTAGAAYQEAGIGPKDLDIVESQDTHAGGEITAYEDLGLCPEGEGGPFVASGATRITGKVAVNPSGGLLSKGEPVGASSLGQIHELVTQLRGDAGKRQVAGCRVGLSQTMGAGGNCCITILKR